MPSPSPTRSPLLRHLAWVLVVKLIVIVALYQVFFKDRAVDTNPASVAQHLLDRPTARTPPQEPRP